MKDITKELEAAGFKNVESLCNTYTAVIPEKRLRVFITVNDREITYSGSFVKTYKKVKNLTELFSTIYKMELSQPDDDAPYDEKTITRDGTLYTFFNGRVTILDANNDRTVIIIDGKRTYIDSPAHVFIDFIASEKDEETTISKLKTMVQLI